MAEKTTGKVAQLTPEEWKQLCILNMVQLHNYLQSIPGNTETGASGLTDQVRNIIDAHLARGHTFLRAWQLSRFEMPQVRVAQPAAPASNGAVKKGGWPKGKKRTRKPATPATAEQ